MDNIYNQISEMELHDLEDKLINLKNKIDKLEKDMSEIELKIIHLKSTN